MRILVPVDESKMSLRVVEYLLRHETLLGAKPEIELVNVQYSVPESIIQLFGMDAVKQYYLETGKNVFDELSKTLDLKPLHAEERVLYGDVGAKLAEEAKDFKTDLIVMGTRGLNPMKGLLLGSVSNALLARTRVPMLLIREATPAIPKKMRVGIFVDGSKYGEAAADFVLAHLELFGPEAQFTVVHCAEPVPDPIAPNPVNPMTPVLTREELEEEQKKGFQEAVQAVLAPFEVGGVNIHAELLIGDPDKKLPEYANANLDLVVMGSHGYGSFTAAVMGSTAMHTAAETHVPILVIRRPEN